MSPQAPANRKQTYGEKFLVTSMFQVNVYCNYSEHWKKDKKKKQFRLTQHKGDKERDKKEEKQ